MVTPSDLIGTRDTAKILGITPASVTRRVSAGTLAPLAKLDGPRGAFVFDRHAIEGEAAK